MSEPLTIKVKYHADIDPLQQIEIGDAIDVRAAEDVDLKFMEHKKISLGFSCELPEGYFAFLLPRSSTFERWGIIQTNSIGLIDNSFNGDNDVWQMPVIALRNDVHIKKNDRIGQFVIIHKSQLVNFISVNTLGNKDRNGFGSTGVN